MASKEMREIEALNEDSVPLSIDDRERVSAANRYFQIGSGACSALLDSALNGTSPEPRQVILLDLFVHTGDMLEAFAKMRAGRGNIHYCGFCESQEEVIYLEAMLKDLLAEGYESGTPTPTGEKIEQSMALDLSESAPPHPRLNIMVTCRQFFFKEFIGHYCSSDCRSVLNLLGE